MKTIIGFFKGENYVIPKESTVKVLETEKGIVIKNTSKSTRSLREISRTSKSEYMNLKTGEIKQYEKPKYKTASTIKHNMNGLKLLLKTNFTFKDNMVFITLTCKNKIEDLEVIRDYNKKFLRKLREKYNSYKLTYIYKFERQQNYSWHVHILVKDENNKKIYIPNEDIKKMWGKGYTFIQKVKKGGTIKVDLTDRKNEVEATAGDVSTVFEYMVKTTQLFDVPNGKQVYGHSSNIKLPKAVTMKYAEAKKILKSINAKLVRENTILIKDVKTNYIINKHKTEEYRK